MAVVPVEPSNKLDLFCKVENFVSVPVMNGSLLSGAGAVVTA